MSTVTFWKWISGILSTIVLALIAAWGADTTRRVGNNEVTQTALVRDVAVASATLLRMEQQMNALTAKVDLLANRTARE